MLLKSKVERLKLSQNKKVSLLNVFEFLRQDYCNKHARNIEQLLEKAEITVPRFRTSPLDHKILSGFTRKENLSWGSVRFHVENRVVDPKDLMELKPRLKPRESMIRHAIRDKGYLLSILPLNLLMPMEVLEQFLPPDDFSDPHPLKSIDPYGIATSEAKVVRSNRWIASRKFPHTALVNVHGYCPIGCSDCYKSFFVREKGHHGEIGPDDLDEKIPRRLKQIMGLLAQWLNENPDVYDVIVSGGEPLIRSNSHIRIILEQLTRAKHLRILRFCTGVVFLGLPFRIDTQLLNIIRSFAEETGVRVTFQTHLSNHFQISAEAAVAVAKIKDYGFEIYSQTPIREGVNFFTEDMPKSFSFLAKLVRKQFLIGIEPYKFIVDMHPRTLRYYVPIEVLTQVFSALFDSHVIPDLERPKTLSLLTRQGNLVLSWHSLFAMKKRVDRRNKIVTYLIPRLGECDLKSNVSQFEYREPLMTHNEDPNSIEKLRRKFR